MPCPWLRIEQKKASPCLGASWRSVNLLPDHSLTLNCCSWERSLREAKHFSAWSIWSLVWSLHISTLKPSQLNTSAKLSARHVIKQMYLGLNYHQISQQCIPVNPSTLWHTGILVSSTSLLPENWISEVLVVYDHTQAGGLAVQLVLLVHKKKQNKKQWIMFVISLFYAVELFLNRSPRFSLQVY